MDDQVAKNQMVLFFRKNHRGTLSWRAGTLRYWLLGLIHKKFTLFVYSYGWSHSFCIKG